MAAASAAIADLSRYSKPPPLGGGVFTDIKDIASGRCLRASTLAILSAAPAIKTFALIRPFHRPAAGPLTPSAQPGIGCMGSPLGRLMIGKQGASSPVLRAWRTAVAAAADRREETVDRVQSSPLVD